MVTITGRLLYDRQSLSLLSSLYRLLYLTVPCIDYFRLLVTTFNFKVQFVHLLFACQCSESCWASVWGPGCAGECPGSLQTCKQQQQQQWRMWWDSRAGMFLLFIQRQFKVRAKQWLQFWTVFIRRARPAITILGPTTAFIKISLLQYCHHVMNDILLHYGKSGQYYPASPHSYFPEVRMITEGVT